MDAPKHSIRVYLCASAGDLRAYRQKVHETILSLEMLPVARHSLTALPDTPAADCCDRPGEGEILLNDGDLFSVPSANCCAGAAQADAVVVLVAHRYGAVPEVNEGGDGKRSLAWLEVAAARAAGKPVFAFLVEPQAPWDQPREQDRLLSEPVENTPDILASLDRLQEFRAYLQTTCPTKTFTSVDDLAAKLAAALAGFARTGEVARVREWLPLVCHALQPAPHFLGRVDLRKELVQWVHAPLTQDRVFSLVAAGGTGKTALAERALSDLKGSVPAGLLVWSFYDDPRTEEFLRVACDYFSGSSDVPVGGRLVRLQQALGGDEAHLLLLDGLERVQALGHDGRPRGTLEDPQLKRLLRYLAGGPGRARALVTSRFPLVDLDSWIGAGHRAVRLDDLDGPSGQAVLHAWGVRGSERVLEVLVNRLHGHALSLAVLGSYLGHFCDGDPARAPAFDRCEASADDPRAARLERILGEYVRVLGNEERDLLARLAAFPGGVKIAVLQILVGAGGRVAGALRRCPETHLAGLLERLRKLGLVFANGARSEAVYTAHPFLQAYFKELLGVRGADVHEVVRARLAPTLEARPDSKPREAELLDRYEALIEHTRLAGRVQEAFDLYWHGLGFYDHLGKVLGENARGLRIVTAFSADGTADKLAPAINDSFRALLASDLGLYSKNLGDLVPAQRAFEFELEIRRRHFNPRNHSVVLQNLCDLALLAGSLPQACKLAKDALESARVARDEQEVLDSHCYLATALAARGDVVAARSHFHAATLIHGRPLDSLRGIWEAEFRLACGYVAKAQEQTQQTLLIAKRHRWYRTVALCDTLLGRLLIANAPEVARFHLGSASEFATSSGDVEILLRAHRLATDLARRMKGPATAVPEAEAGILLADSCGCGLHAIDLRLALARAHLDAGDARAAHRRACEALERATAPECAYAWGKADALDLAGRAHLRLREWDLGRDRLSAALALRQRLGHAGVTSTRFALEELIRPDLDERCVVVVEGS
jgi:hypothetical protein